MALEHDLVYGLCLVLINWFGLYFCATYRMRYNAHFGGTWPESAISTIQMSNHMKKHVGKSNLPSLCPQA